MAANGLNFCGGLKGEMELQKLISNITIYFISKNEKSQDC